MLDIYIFIFSLSLFLCSIPGVLCPQSSPRHYRTLMIRVTQELMRMEKTQRYVLLQSPTTLLPHHPTFPFHLATIALPPHSYCHSPYSPSDRNVLMVIFIAPLKYGVFFKITQIVFGFGAFLLILYIIIIRCNMHSIPNLNK